MNINKQTLRRWGSNVATVLVPLGVLIAVIGGVSYLAGWHPIQGIVRGLQASAMSWWFIARILGLILLGLALAVGIVPRVTKNVDGETYVKTYPLGWFAMVLVVLIGGWFVGIRPELRRPHDVKHEAINQVLTVKKAAMPSYETRVPYTLAERRLSRALGSERTVLGGIWAFKVDGVAKACGVMYPAASQWKRPMLGVACLDLATNEVEKPRFAAKVGSSKVTFGDLRLQHVVATKAPYATYVESDIYGYVRDGKPFMVVPLRMRSGNAVYTEAWGGALVFDTNGKVVHHKTVTDEVPGPIAGESLAEQVLGAVNDRGGYVERNQKRNTYDFASPPSAYVRIPDDWSTNVKHFMLERTDGTGPRLVSMLTPLRKSYGAGSGASEQEKAESRQRVSDTIVAALEIDPRKVSFKSWPKAVLYELPEDANRPARVSIAEAQDLVRSRYGATLQLANSQLNFVEPTPTKTDTLRVTIAGQQEVVAYAEVNLLDRSSCLYRADGEKVRCDTSGSSVLDENTTDGTDNPENTNGTPATGPVITQEQAKALTKEQLAETIKVLTDALASK